MVAGQLDMIAPNPGNENWVRKLRWPGKQDWKETSRQLISINNVLEGYYKENSQLGLYWIDRAGHSVPSDNPVAGRWLLQHVLGL